MLCDHLLPWIGSVQHQLRQRHRLFSATHRSLCVAAHHAMCLDSNVLHIQSLQGV
jgi:hypothetical protein